MNDVKCDKCGSVEGSTIYCKGSCGNPDCKEPRHFFCECGHTTSFYHITKLGREVLKILKVE